MTAPQLLRKHCPKTAGLVPIINLNTAVMASAAARERYARKNEAADLKRAFNVLDSKGDGKIDPDELNQVFQTLGHKPRRGEVEDLIWEVDEDCDGCIGWQEFQRMYHRCRQDSTGELARADI